jgi:hypothetical protein
VTFVLICVKIYLMKTQKAVTYKKPANRSIRLAKSLSAAEAIGELKQQQDTYILTFGQFSLVDALVHVLSQTGPANVDLSTWTAADAHLERTKALMDSADILRYRMIVDRSFESRQPQYVYHMRKLFGFQCIRAVRTHAKFFVVSNAKWRVAARTSMNLNENPRLENIEISTDPGLADFLIQVVDEIFHEVCDGENRSPMVDLEAMEQASPYKLVQAGFIKDAAVPFVTHEIKKG